MSWVRAFICVVCGALASGPASARQLEPPIDDDQVVPRPPCISGEHTPSGCYLATLESIAHYVTVSTTIDPVGEPLRKFGAWHAKPACNCFYSACDDARRRICGPMVALYARQSQTCWKVTGSASAQAKTGLLASLFAELNITLSIGGELSGCTTVTQSLTFEVPGNDCFTNYARDIWEEQRVVGSALVAETVYYWDCQRPNNLIETVATYCNIYNIRGDVDTVASRGVEYSEAPVSCGGPADPIGGPPYKRSLKCCSPIAGCDPTNPPTACCGCWSPQ